jgi:hypothetical protein
MTTAMANATIIVDAAGHSMSVAVLLVVLVVVVPKWSSQSDD